MTDEQFITFMALRQHANMTLKEISVVLKVAVRTLSFNLSRGLPSSRIRRARKGSSAVLARRKLVKRLLTKRVRLEEQLPASTRKNARKPRTQLRHPFGSLTRCRRELAVNHSIEVSKSTLHRDVKASGLLCRKRPNGPTRYKGDPEMRLKHCRSILAFAKASWKDVIFVDEKFFDSQDRDVYAYVGRGQAPPARERERFPSRCHVFGLIGFGLKKLVVFPSTARLDSDIYLEKCMKPNLKLLKSKFLLQDGAGCHKGLMEWLREKKVRLVEHSARSPDLNPIERLWGTVQRQVSARGPLTEDGLVRFVKEQWEAIPQSEVDKYVASWPKMVEAVIRAKGETAVRPAAL